MIWLQWKMFNMMPIENIFANYERARFKRISNGPNRPEYTVGVVDLLEHFLRLDIVRVLIRMVFQSQTPVFLLDLLIGRGLGDVQQLVETVARSAEPGNVVSLVAILSPTRPFLLSARRPGCPFSLCHYEDTRDSETRYFLLTHSVELT